VGIETNRARLYSCRHSGATRYLRSGMDLASVMRLGGWRDLASVQRYLGLLFEDKLEAQVEAAWA
jgi:site-specific recombinase XerD